MNSITKIFTTCVLAIVVTLTGVFGNYSAKAVEVSPLFALSNKNATSYPTDDSQIEGLLYSDSDEVESLKNVDDIVSPRTQRELLDPTRIPAAKQPIINRGDPNNQILEKTQQSFKEAGEFLGN